MIDEELYQFASDELNSNRRNQELWNRACALARDDHDEARFLYKNLRVEELLELQANGEPLPFIPSSASSSSASDSDVETPSQDKEAPSASEDSNTDLEFSLFDASTSDKGLRDDEVVQSTSRGFTESNSDSAADLSEDFLLELDPDALSDALEREHDREIETQKQEVKKPITPSPATDFGKTPSALPDGFSSAGTAGSDGFSAIDPEISSLAAMATERIRKRAGQDADDSAATDDSPVENTSTPFEPVKPYTFEDEANAFEATLKEEPDAELSLDDTQQPDSEFLASFPDEKPAGINQDYDAAPPTQSEHPDSTEQDTFNQTLEYTELDLTGQADKYNSAEPANENDTIAFLDGTSEPTRTAISDGFSSVIPEKDPFTEDLERQADTWLPTDAPAAVAIDDALPLIPAAGSQIKPPSDPYPLATDYSAAGAGAKDSPNPPTAAPTAAQLGPASLRSEEASSLLDGQGAVYRVFRNSKDTRAVKDGLSWSAMFFTLPWLLVKRLPGTALIYIVLWAVLAVGLLITGIQWLDTPTEAAADAALWPIGFAALAFVGTLLVPLFLANRWYAQALTKRGYREVAKVRAVNARSAVERLSSLSA